MMLSLLAPFVYTLVLLMAGLPILLLLAPRDARMRAELWLPLAFALGWSLHAVSVKWCLVLLGVMPAALLPLLAVFGLAGTGALVHTGRAAALRGFTLHRVPPSGAMLYIALLLLIAARFILLTTDALRFPLFTWDGRMTWNLKAILLYHEGAVATEAFLDPLRIHFHRDYPLMLPIAYTGVYQLAGG
ncbi:MAG: hypothetical protein JJU11_09210, partial [Candidatus Sumerlaeia bacterium]|nr:hypothetical protein [Candidatus Sumerlaeia bacterium]